MELANPADAPDAVARLADSGVDFVKLFYDSMCCAFHKAMPKLEKPVMERVNAEAHRHGLPAATHVYELEGHRDVLRAGGDIDDDYIELARANGAFYVVTLSIYNDTFNPDAVREWTATNWVQDSVPKVTLETLDVGGPLDGFESFTRRDNISRQLPTIMKNMKRIHDAGIPFAVGPDTGVPGAFPGDQYAIQDADA